MGDTSTITIPPDVDDYEEAYRDALADLTEHGLHAEYKAVGGDEDDPRALLVREEMSARGVDWL